MAKRKNDGTGEPDSKRVKKVVTPPVVTPPVVTPPVVTPPVVAPPVVATQPDEVLTDATQPDEVVTDEEGPDEGPVAKVRALAPGGSFSIAAHEDLPAQAIVRLRPRVDLKGDQISQVVFGRTRTPSPFADGRMGDHTVAWQALVDSVHARVHNLTLPAAIAEIRQRQEAVQAWMTDTNREVAGRRLFRLLQADEMARRRPLLEDAGARVGQLLDQATARLNVAVTDAEAGADEKVDGINLSEYADNGANLDEVVAAEGAAAEADAVRPSVPSAASYLGMAIAQHLTYLNYLPFATVPALSVRGSVGSAEGAWRSVILWQEDQGGPKDAPLIEDDQERAEVTDALWGMLSFSAALREAETDLAVVPAATATPIRQAAALGESVTQLTVIMAQYLDRPPKRMKNDRPELVGEPAEITDPDARRRVCNQVEKAADVVLADAENYSVLGDLARQLNQAAEFLRGQAPGEQKAPDYRSVVTYKAGLARLVSEASLLSSYLKAKQKHGLEETALILAYLLRDHQETVARAYPRAVTVTGFLGEKPVAAAVARLKAEIAANLTESRSKRAALKKSDSPREVRPPLKPDPKKLAELLKQVAVLYGEFGAHAPEAAATNSWTKVSESTGLVANWDNGELVVTGRARAPLGVEGMGSHTTAWALEVMALKALLAPAAAKKEDPLKPIREAVIDELGKGPIELDYLLPADQLASGQLQGIFDAAVATLRATDVSVACAHYLTFRNLLPYATVDAGDRGGHGERTSASRKKLFDSGSLRQAATLKADECGVGRGAKTASVLSATAKLLSEAPNVAWADRPSVADAVESAIERLEEEAARLVDGDGLDVAAKADIVRLIIRTRQTEHNRVFKHANTVPARTS